MVQKQKGELFGDCLQGIAERPDLKPKKLHYSADFPALRDGENTFSVSWVGGEASLLIDDTPHHCLST